MFVIRDLVITWNVNSMVELEVVTLYEDNLQAL